MGKWGDLARSLGSATERIASAEAAISAIGTTDASVVLWETDAPNPTLATANSASGAIGTRGWRAAMSGRQPPTVDQTARYHECAAIAEFDGGLPRAHAEVLAALNTLDLAPEAAGILNIVAKRLEFLAQAGEIS